MSDAVELSFKIGAYTPRTIPMGRLAEYMAELSKMIGQATAVHFVRLDEGSTQIIHVVESEAFPKVEARVESVRRGEAPIESLDAYRAINRMLRDDNASGDYRRLDRDADILDFPGVKAPKPVQLEPVAQPGTLDGVVQGVGGRGHYPKEVPVYVMTGSQVHSCVASKDVAIELAHHTFGAELRFTGQATWVRDDDGAWRLTRFVILTSAQLDQTPLSQVVDELRAIPSDWSTIKDPWGEIIRLRDDDGELH
jgi:hypothetical protein